MADVDKTDDAAEPIRYDLTSSVEPYVLIAEMKKNPILFDCGSSENKNVLLKNALWDNVNAVIFPNFNELPNETKDVIRITVRKKWKSLRDAVVKDRRFRLDHPEAAKRRKLTPINQEMQFIVPYIRYPARPRKRSYSSDENHSSDFSKPQNDDTIDLTYQEQQELDSEESPIQIDDDENDSVHSQSESEDEDFKQLKEDVCFPSEDNFSYAMPKTEFNYTTREYDVEDVKHEEERQHQKMYKRKRTDSGGGELQAKLNKILDRYNDESQDEDRMFLLSLLSDFKRVPTKIKVQVKSVFVKTLCDALNTH